jgi:molybdopterin-binding protein
MTDSPAKRHAVAEESVMRRPALLPPREASRILGISYPTLKQWIYRGKIKTVKTPGGHHRVPESEIDRMIPKKLDRGDIAMRRGNFRKISGRNQLVGRVISLKYSGLLAQVTMAIGEQHITALITADAAKEMRLKPGERAAALIKSTEVMILRV